MRLSTAHKPGSGMGDCCSCYNLSSGALWLFLCHRHGEWDKGGDGMGLGLKLEDISQKEGILLLFFLCVVVDKQSLLCCGVTPLF